MADKTKEKNNKTSGAINESLYCKLKFISRAGIFMADIYGGGHFLLGLKIVMGTEIYRELKSETDFESSVLRLNVNWTA